MQEIETQIEHLIVTINKKINFDRNYIIRPLKNTLKERGLDYLPELKKKFETKIEISELYINYLENIVKDLEHILQ